MANEIIIADKPTLDAVNTKLDLLSKPLGNPIRFSHVFSGTYANWVDVVNVTGKGELITLTISLAQNAATTAIRVTVDGVLLNSDAGFGSNLGLYYPTAAFGSGSGEWQTGQYGGELLHIPFKSSLRIQVKDGIANNKCSGMYVME